MKVEELWKQTRWELAADILAAPYFDVVVDKSDASQLSVFCFFNESFQRNCCV